jgi:3-dehydroquinate synthetase
MTPLSPRRRVLLRAASGKSLIEIAPGLLGTSAALQAITRSSRRAAIIADSGARPWAILLHQTLASAGVDASLLWVTPRESAKTLATAQRLLVQLARLRHERTEPIIALGGGLTGDLAAFVAAIYRRGVPCIQAPTTLLAMVDAAVGGKTAVNLNVGSDLLKNMVGVFRQPPSVLVDVSTLATLPARELRCGLAECVKHAMLDPGASLLSWTRRSLPAILSGDGSALVDLVWKNVRLKASIVADDEHEQHAGGGRALLNLGHTFAHALETLPGLTLIGPQGSVKGPPKHGEAVALGLRAALHASLDLNLINLSYAADVNDLLDQIGLPVAVRGLPGPATLLSRMTHDKKVLEGRLRLILPSGPGRARVLDDVPEPVIRRAWRSLHAGTALRRR